jgi:hypothetical protein
MWIIEYNWDSFLKAHAKGLSGSGMTNEQSQKVANAYRNGEFPLNFGERMKYEQIIAHTRVVICDVFAFPRPM